MEFKLVSKFKPRGDQPEAIKKLAKNLKAGVSSQVLLGVTGSGKTFTMAKVIEKIRKPALIISPNKTLAAQLYQEFREFFPNNAVHYFVSYYDYYQPEAYIPQTNTYIEKDAKINEEIDALRHASVQDLLTKKDVIIIASVSCIFGIGSPESYGRASLELSVGQKIKRKDLLLLLASLQYQRNDADFKPGHFRVRGDIVEIRLVTGKETLRIEISQDKIGKLSIKNQQTYQMYRLFPAQFWATPQDKLKISLENIKAELREQLSKLKAEKKFQESQKLEQRTNYDLEMLQETGYCHGIENYSRHLDFRKPGEPPFTLLDYFPGDSLIFIDESHITLSQLHAMAVQDRARKETLIKYGYRLPSAADNRPLTFREFEKKSRRTIYVSATPGPYEKENPITEQLIRPTGLLEPSIEIRPTKNQINDLIGEIKRRRSAKQRTLVVTLTKKLAEAVSDYLAQEKIKARWLHSEIKTMERPKIINDFREGKYDVLVGINLLREGLDLPEVSLVAILDADKEGFLRNETTLIQTMGRAARHKDGHVIMYADQNTGSMKSAAKEIMRRRKIQQDYNKKLGIVPSQIIKEIRNWPFKSDGKAGSTADFEKEMDSASRNFDFERAAALRDLISKIKGAKKEIR